MALSDKKDTFTENDLSLTFCGLWRGWVDRIEPASGSTMGFPDVILFHPHTGSIPVELKLACFPKPHIIAPVGGGMRPVQIGWHKRYYTIGGVSAIVLGVMENEKLSLYLVSGKDADKINEGMNILSSDIVCMSPFLVNRSLLQLFTRWVEEMKKTWLP